MKRKPKYYKLLALLFFLFLLLVAFLQEKYALISILITVAGALITALIFLSKQNDRHAKSIIKSFEKILHIEKSPVRTGIVDIHDPYYNEVKKKILNDVIKKCQDILKDDLIVQIANNNNLKKSADNFIVPEKNRYDNFFQYYEKEIEEHGSDKNFQLFSDDLKIFSTLGILILGEPGNGKTCYLAKWILREAMRIKTEYDQNNFTSNIPVFISLGNIKVKNWDVEIFEDWVGQNFYNQAEEKNFTPEQIISLLTHHALIPVLDGLDEVIESCRFECFESICKYAGKENSLIFSCRTNDFNSLLKKYIHKHDLNDFEEDEDEEKKRIIGELKTIEVLKLKTIEDDVKRIIADNTNGSKEILDYLDAHKNIIAFINTPLFLNLFLFVYDGLSGTEKRQIAALSEEQFKQRMFEKFEQRMYSLRLRNHVNPILVKKKNKTGHSEINSKTIREDKIEKRKKADDQWRSLISDYLVNISHRLKSIGIKSFFVENIQPNWLDKSGKRLFYYLTSRIISGVFLSVAIGLFVAETTSFIGNGIVASIAVALLTMILNRRKKPFPQWAVVPLFIIITTATTFLYQGFAVKRTNTDMKFYGVFSLTESFSGIILGVFFGAIFGYRKKIQDKSKDIQPVINRKFRFNKKRAFKTGLAGGTIIGLIVAILAVLVKMYGVSNTFYRWFDNLIKILIDKIGSHITFVANSFKEYTFTFLFAFIVITYIAFSIFALLAGREETSIESEANARVIASLNYGIKQSLLNSLKYGVIVLISMTILYYSLLLLIYTSISQSVPGDAKERAFMIGAGFAIISSLWFGGFEYIQHWTLRVALFFWGIIPLSIDRWVIVIQDLSFMKKIGPSLEFYHDDLKDYYYTAPQKSDIISVVYNKSKKVIRFFFIIFLLIFSALLLRPLVQRGMPVLTQQHYHFYWLQPDEINYLIATPSTLHKIDRNIIEIYDTAKAIKRDTLVVSVSGKVHAGTFTGKVSPKGAKTGFLGLPLTTVYNIDTTNLHCALLYRFCNNEISKWQPVVSQNMVSDSNQYLIPVQKNDMIKFCVNDSEWENNSGHFTVTLRLKSSNEKL